MVAADRGRPGKIASLRAFLAEHAEAVEADVAARYPGRSLKELFRGSMSYRELGVFVRHLPQDSWTQTIIRDHKIDELTNPEPELEPSEPRFGPWAQINYQLAELTDAVNQNTYMTMVAGNLKGKDDKGPTPPEPTPRPGLKRAVQQRRNPEAVVLYLDRLRARG